jgi:ribosomal protein S18 acetylase RimI-like enzyme
MNLGIRPLGIDDAIAYRTLRLEALKNNPEAFNDDFDAARARPDTDWAKLLVGDTRVFFGAFIEGKLVGAVNFKRGPGKTEQHKGHLLGVYVSPTARGSGCAKQLIEAVLCHARGRVSQVHLGVGTYNANAMKLYSQAGFESYGVEPRSLFVDGKYIDEQLMVKFLDGKNENE